MLRRHQFTVHRVSSEQGASPPSCSAPACPVVAEDVTAIDAVFITTAWPSLTSNAAHRIASMEDIPLRCILRDHGCGDRERGVGADRSGVAEGGQGVQLRFGVVVEIAIDAVIGAIRVRQIRIGANRLRDRDP